MDVISAQHIAQHISTSKEKLPLTIPCLNRIDINTGVLGVHCNVLCSSDLQIDLSMVWDIPRRKTGKYFLLVNRLSLLHNHSSKIVDYWMRWHVRVELRRVFLRLVVSTAQWTSLSISNQIQKGSSDEYVNNWSDFFVYRSRILNDIHPLVEDVCVIITM